MLIGLGNEEVDSVLDVVKETENNFWPQET